MDPNPLSDVDPDAYVDAEAEVSDLIARRNDVPTLPDVGEEVWHGGRAYTVASTNVSTRHLPNPGGADRWKLDVHITAWNGDVPFEDHDFPMPL